MEENKEVAIYGRVSTNDQAEKGFSLDAQVSRLKSYCESRNWNVFDVYVDNGFSGRNVHRPKYKEMMKNIDGWDVILVIKMDRIHRNSKNFMSMMEVLESKGKDFVSMTESLDTSTAMGRFVMDIIQRIAQLESEQIGERVFMGMEQKAISGNCRNGGRIPLGYVKHDGKYIIDELERKVVEQVFSMYISGMSCKRIADYLNSVDVSTKYDAVWRSQTVITILKNPFYCGYYHWNGYVSRGIHKKIVTKKLFLKVQSIIKSRKGKPFCFK